MPPSSEAKAYAPDEVLEITRTFDAPPALLWRLWSNPEHIVRWWGPQTCWLEVCEMDFREGGAWRFWMRNGSGLDHWIGGTYREIRPHERLSFTYVNAYDGHEMVVAIDFIDLGARTEMRFLQAPFLNEVERDGHRVGWTSTFELLAAYLLRFEGVIEVTPVGRPRRDGVAEDIVAAR
jgi:uncharacterized protein YndB with AHSA1/START domain